MFGARRPRSHPVTVSIGTGPPGPAVAGDFAGLSFERGPLNPGNAGVPGYLFSPANTSLITLFRNMGLRSLRIGGGSVENMAIAGLGSDGFTGIDNLFAFAAAAQVQVTYSLRLLSPAASPIQDLASVNARLAGYIWQRYRENVASFAIGNEPDWHSFHSHAGHQLDPAIVEETPGVPGTAYRSYLARWRDLAGAVTAAAPGALLSGPDTGDYTRKTYSPDPGSGVSWTERFAADAPGHAAVAEITQHYYAGHDPGRSTARQAIGNMLSPEWVTGTEIGRQPAGTSYTPYPWLYRSNLAPVAATGLRYRLTESNDYLGGVAGASNAFAAALWALDHLHWWAAHGAAGVHFHNKQWLYTGTVVPSRDGPGADYAITPKGYAIKAFTLGSVGQVRPAEIGNPDGINVTAYAVGTRDAECVTIINKTYGRRAADAVVTVSASRLGPYDAEVITVASKPPGDVTSATATLGGATITGDAPWAGTWSLLATGASSATTLTVPAATAAVVRLRARS